MDNTNKIEILIVQHYLRNVDVGQVTARPESCQRPKKKTFSNKPEVPQEIVLHGKMVNNVFNIKGSSTIPIQRIFCGVSATDFDHTDKTTIERVVDSRSNIEQLTRQSRWEANYNKTFSDEVTCVKVMALAGNVNNKSMISLYIIGIKNPNETSNQATIKRP